MTMPSEVQAPGVPEDVLPEGDASAQDWHPTEPIGAGLQASLTVAFFGTWLALLPIGGITLPLKVAQIDEAHKTVLLSQVLAIGAFVALVAQNIFGALSDRTTSRFGMRRPYLFVGTIAAVGSLVFLTTANSVPALMAAWALTQLTFNILLAGLNPIMPDQTPKHQLGRVSALVGITQTLSAVGGAFIVQQFLPDLNRAILVPGAFTIVGVGILLVVLKDRILPKEQAQKLDALIILKAFWTNPRKAPDFALAWVSRFMVTFGNMTLASYQVYFLMDRLGYTQANIGGAVLQLTLATTITTVITSLTVGRISDRINRRKLFVLISAIVLAVAHAAVLLASDLTGVLIAASIAGLATGIYSAVDSALIAEVLPSSQDVAKDMGVLHLANVFPQMLVPIVAPLFLAIGSMNHTNYAALFIGGAVIGIIGAIVNQFIKSVR